MLSAAQKCLYGKFISSATMRIIRTIFERYYTKSNNNNLRTLYIKLKQRSAHGLLLTYSLAKTFFA